jgi:hypothetical protein
MWILAEYNKQSQFDDDDDDDDDDEIILCNNKLVQNFYTNQ